MALVPRRVWPGAPCPVEGAHAAGEARRRSPGSSPGAGVGRRGCERQVKGSAPRWRGNANVIATRRPRVIQADCCRSATRSDQMAIEPLRGNRPAHPVRNVVARPRLADARSRCLDGVERLAGVRGVSDPGALAEGGATGGHWRSLGRRRRGSGSPAVIARPASAPRSPRCWRLRRGDIPVHTPPAARRVVRNGRCRRSPAPGDSAAEAGRRSGREPNLAGDGQPSANGTVAPGLSESGRGPIPPRTPRRSPSTVRQPRLVAQPWARRRRPNGRAGSVPAGVEWPSDRSLVADRQQSAASAGR